MAVIDIEKHLEKSREFIAKVEAQLERNHAIKEQLLENPKIQALINQVGAHKSDLAEADRLLQQQLDRKLVEARVMASEPQALARNKMLRLVTKKKRI